LSCSEKDENAFSLYINHPANPEHVAELYFGAPRSYKNNSVRYCFNSNGRRLACVLCDGWVFATTHYIEGAFGKKNIPEVLLVIASADSNSSQIVSRL
jgi:hypothetical protein